LSNHCGCVSHGANNIGNPNPQQAEAATWENRSDGNAAQWTVKFKKDTPTAEDLSHRPRHVTQDQYRWGFSQGSNDIRQRSELVDRPGLP
jgi:hypothetical protein